MACSVKDLGRAADLGVTAVIWDLAFELGTC